MQSPKILLIEDSHEFAFQIKLRLEKAGYLVDVASDGNIGLRMARENKPALILLDLMLPELDGYHLCRLLKYDHNYKHIPVIVLTARSLEQDKELALETGADAYLIKPVNWDELLLTMNNLLADYSNVFESKKTSAKV